MGEGAADEREGAAREAGGQIRHGAGRDLRVSGGAHAEHGLRKRRERIGEGAAIELEPAGAEGGRQVGEQVEGEVHHAIAEEGFLDARGGGARGELGAHDGAAVPGELRGEGPRGGAEGQAARQPAEAGAEPGEGAGGRAEADGRVVVEVHARSEGDDPAHRGAAGRHREAEQAAHAVADEVHGGPEGADQRRERVDVGAEALVAAAPRDLRRGEHGGVAAGLKRRPQAARRAQGRRGRPGGERKAVPVAAQAAASRTVDEFDFDEEAFLAALDENEIVGTTGEVVSGTVVGVESDGVYVDIGGKAPGFMPKNEAGLGVITNLKERFPRGLQVEVLVTREQNADGMVTISARALALRQSWEKVRQLEKDGKVVQVQVTGFNRGGVTCDLEGLRGFIPRSQLLDGENHEALVGKTLGVSFLEVNPETRKLVLSERRASTAARFGELEVGQLVEGQVAAIKPYGFFVDLGGVSGLLHQSSITGGALRDLREAFEPGERIKALITSLDPGRGRIALNTALLEGQPGEILIAKATVMAEATDRANRARSLLRQQEQEAG